MTTSPSRHSWAAATVDLPPQVGLPVMPEPLLEVRCHRRLAGPYTGGGALLRRIVPEVLRERPDLVAARATEVVALAPDLAPMVPVAPRTLTSLASRAERTRFYAVARTLRISHGVAELVTDWARLRHPGGVAVAFRETDDADNTDRELLSVLLRRCDPRLVTIVVESDGPADDALGTALGRHAERVVPRWRSGPQPPAGGDLAQWFINSDGTSRDAAVRTAYEALAPDERARRHDARAEVLLARNDPTLQLGAPLLHLERGSDRTAAAEAFVLAVADCFDRGYYEAALELAMRGRTLYGADRPKGYWNLVSKVGACLSYLGRGVEGFAYFGELRAGTIEPDIHMNACYMMAMLYTRHLPKGDHDETRALEWVNTAIAIADRHPDIHRRAFTGAFMRNARALVELHRGDLSMALRLVNEAIAMTDADLGPDEQLLHRSVLLYNRAQIFAAQGDYESALRDYDEVIRRDPDYGDYYFERASAHRAAGLVSEALQDYAEAIRLSPPLHEAHFNRADLLRELGDDDAALRDLDYAIEVEPAFVDSRVNRADLLLALGELDRARVDIEEGLALDPHNANLLSARGALLTETGEVDAACASYTAALAADPRLVAAWANRAILAYSAGRLADALDDLDHAIALADDPRLRANRAIALQELGEHRRAVQDFDLAIAALADEDPDLLYRRGASHYALGEPERATEDWRAHLSAYNGQPSPYVAQIQLRAGDLVASVPEGVG